MINSSNYDPSVSYPISYYTDEHADDLIIDLLEGAFDPNPHDVLGVSNLTLFNGKALGTNISGNSLYISTTLYQYLPFGSHETLVYRYDIVDGSGARSAKLPL